MVAVQRKIFHLILFLLLLVCTDLFIMEFPVFQPLPRAVVLRVISDFILTIPLLIYWFVLRLRRSPWPLISVERNSLSLIRPSEKSILGWMSRANFCRL